MMQLPTPLSNALGTLGKTLTKVGDGMKRFSGSFTPVAGAKQKDAATPANTNTNPLARSTTTAGQVVPPMGPDKPTTPEQTFDTSLHPGTEPTAASLVKPGEHIRQPIKTGTDVSQDRVQQYLLARFNPIRGLSPRLLSTYLEQFDLGFIRWASLTFNKIRERDDAISAAMQSRECKPADMGWEIVASEESDEAEAHRAALEEFYNHLSVTHALDQNQRGGTSLLVRQMMRAVGDKFAVHEIVWVPTTSGLTAELRFIPLWFFENRTGQLRFLPYELALQGVPLEPGGWMVHVGEGLFPVLSILYLYKQMGLKGWVAYMDKFQIPFLHAKTQAEYESAEWQALLTAMQNFASDGGIVTKATTELTPIVMGSQGAAPHEPFCDRMDRAVARVVRGGDLSSMSKGGGAGGGGAGKAGGAVGALPQMENENALAKADAERISETCQFYLDRWVINYRFGEGVEPKAKFMIQPPQQIDTDREIAVDTFLLSVGVPTSVADLLERYGRARPDAKDALAHAPQPAGLGKGGPPGAGAGQTAPGEGEGPEKLDAGFMANVAPGTRRFYKSANELRAAAQAKAFKPLRDQLLTIAAIEDPATRAAHLEALRLQLPALLHRSVTPEIVHAFEAALSTSIVNGAADAAHRTGYPHSRVNGIAAH